MYFGRSNEPSGARDFDARWLRSGLPACDQPAGSGFRVTVNIPGG